MKKKKKKKWYSGLWNKKDQQEYWINIGKKIITGIQQDDSTEDVETIPSLTLERLPKKVKCFSQEKGLYKDIPYQWVENDDNGIVYLWWYFDITDIAYEMKKMSPILPTLAVGFTDFGLIDTPYEVLSAEIKSTTGRLGGGT